MQDRLTSILSCFLVSALLLFAVPARAEQAEVRTECAEAYEQAQEERAERHFLDARQKLHACSKETCPDFMQADCSQWLAEIEGTMPTMVFAVRTEGEDVSDVRVLMDGKLLVTQLDGAAVSVDPGPHDFTFEHAASKTRVTKRLLAREGEKNRLVTVEIGVSRYLASDSPSTRSQAGSSQTTVNVLPYALLGVGGVGVLSFAVFGLVGNSRLSELESSCSPTCSDAAVSSLRTKWLVADISLGIGVVSLGAATYLLLTQDNAPETAKRALPVDVAVGQNGGIASLRQEF